ncbi:MAG: NCS2 family permease [Thermoactinomyces sp.]
MKNHLSFDFELKAHRTSWKTELVAGMTSFFTSAYILLVNPHILSDAGIPLSAGLIATILASVAGCLFMGLLAKAPVIVVPGMGVNAFFSYTIVQSLGLSWKQGLAVVMVSGIFFLLASVTSFGNKLAMSVPVSLKLGITAGVGLLLTFIGLQKGRVIQPSETLFVKLGNFGDPVMVSTLLGLVITLFLFVRSTRGSMLIGLFATSLLTILLTGQFTPSLAEVQVNAYPLVFANAEFSFLEIPFWIAVFSMTMIVLFENMGLLNGLLADPEKFPRAYQALALSTFASGLFGTSPTVAAAESSSGIAEGGKTGIPALISAILFAASVFLLPLIGMIPDNAVAPVLIIVGALMMKSVREIPFQDFSEGFPAFLIIACIPFTSSIADGLAFGFIVYPLLKIAAGKWKQVPHVVYLIAGLFLINFIASLFMVH